MESKHYLSIVVPVFNEEESLPKLYEEISSVMADDGLRYELILVDDGSEDRSYEICKGLHETDPDHIVVISFRRNFGQTAAMAAGFDADLQNDPADIKRLIEQIDAGYDVVSGWRADRQDKFITRRIPSMIANGIISRITGVHIHDYGCTLKAYRREVIGQMHLYGEMHRFLPALANWAGAKVKEIKVNHRSRQYGTSKYGLNRTLRVVLDLITIKFLLSYSTKPMQVFGKWGFYALICGVLSGIVAVVMKLVPPHQDITSSPWLYFTIFFLLGGIQLICMGLLGEINVRTYYESQRKAIYTVRETHGLEKNIS
jgi:glycosyltransferase involved in cell wall biosynthesis